MQVHILHILHLFVRLWLVAYGLSHSVYWRRLRELRCQLLYRSRFVEQRIEQSFKNLLLKISSCASLFEGGLSMYFHLEVDDFARLLLGLLLVLFAQSNTKA